MPESVLQRAFNAGELAPALSARADQSKYLSGLRTCRNFMVRRHGGVTKRPGTRFIAEVKDSALLPRLLRFIFEGNDQTYLIEAGEGYFRFYWHGEAVLAVGSAWDAGTSYVIGDLVSLSGTSYYCILANSGTAPPNATYWYAQPASGVYEIPSPYTVTQLGRLITTQSADVLTITHTSHVPYELQRLGHTTWRLVAFSTAPWTTKPTGLGVTPGGAGTLSASYKITAAKLETFEETYASDAVTAASSAAPTEALPNVLAWTAKTGATEYYIYKDAFGNGAFGFIGYTPSTSFRDVGFIPDYTDTPPVERTYFNAPNLYPRVCVYHQQRLWLGGGNSNPELVQGSQVGAYHNFSTSNPIQADDAVGFVLAGSTLNPVRHLVSLDKMIVLTDGGEWILHGDESGVITPEAINAESKGQVGANAVVPVVIGDTVLYVQARGCVVRDLFYEGESGKLDGQDLTIFAPHLFEGYTIRELAYARQPHSIMWAVRSDGTLLGLTYLKEHDVWGWHRHDTDGVFERVCVLPDTTDAEDEAYVVVRRTINGSTVRYIEQIESSWNQETEDIEDAFYVDCGLTYDGAPVSTLTGLEHLEAARVAIFADGAVLSDGLTGTAFVVSGGELALGVSASVVQVGLPMTADLETLDLDVQGTSIRDKQKRVQSLVALVEGSQHGFFAGLDEDHLVAERQAPWESATAIVTGQMDVNITTNFTEHGRVLIRSASPVPFTVNGIIPNIQVGG